MSESGEKKQVFRWDQYAKYESVEPSQIRTPRSTFGNAMAAIQKLIPIQDIDQLLKNAVELLRTDLDLERTGIFVADLERHMMVGTWGTGIEGATTDEHHVEFPIDANLEALLNMTKITGHPWGLTVDMQLANYSEASEDVVLPAKGWIASTPISSFSRFRGVMYNDSAISQTPPDPVKQEGAAMFCALLGNLLEHKEVELRLLQMNADLEDRVQERTRQLQMVNSRLRSTLAALEEGVISSNATGKVLLVNDAAARFTGWSEDDQRPLEVLLPLRAESVEGHDPWTVLHSNGSGASVVRALCQRHDGVERLVEMAQTPLSSEEGLSDTVLTFRDITEHEALRREKERADRLASLAELAGGIAHDFNNLLMVVHGRLSILRATTVDTRAMELATQAESASVRARHLTGQLLALARGRRPTFRTIFLEEPLRESLEMVIRESKAELDLRIPPEIHAIAGDVGQLGQVFQNIALNAVQAMNEEGRLLVTVRTVMFVSPEQPSQGRTPHVEVEFRDNGPGIPSAILPKIFDPLFTTKSSGTGLGLSTCFSLVRAHGGYIEAENNPEGGASFRLFFPALEEVHFAQEPAHLSEADGIGGLSGRILAMDDQIDVLETIADMSSVLGLDCTTCRDGNEVIQRIKEAQNEGHPYRLVILDLNTRDGLGGQETLAMIRENDPRLPCILSSGAVDDPMALRPKEFGFTAFLAKPYGLEQLRRLLEQILS